MLTHQITKQVGKILTADLYHENITELFSATYRTDIQNILEANLRAEAGAVINRPLGSPRRTINFDGLAFSPVFLTRLPTPHHTKINTTTVIGKRQNRLFCRPRSSSPVWLMPCTFKRSQTGTGQSFSHG